MPHPVSRAVLSEHGREFGPYRYVYAVVSRRSQGLSIGINLNPDKSCSFNCVYCQVERKNTAKKKPVRFPVLMKELHSILDQYLNGCLHSHERFSSVTDNNWLSLKDIAISGDGEATLSPFFNQAVELVLDQTERLKKEHAINVKPVLITNGSNLGKRNIRSACERLVLGGGEIWVKLDSGNADDFREINQGSVPFQRFLKNLFDFGKTCPLILQTLVFSFPDGRLSLNLNDYVLLLQKGIRAGFKPRSIQLYTLARKTRLRDLRALSVAGLQAMAEEIREKTTCCVEVFP
ncbi:MAG: hypothetical protein JW774_03550 [Candidatus Aureabacteria bacterium]|nr:hypothetical protein [Candidatus Auribacterota bacterium]